MVVEHCEAQLCWLPLNSLAGMSNILGRFDTSFGAPRDDLLCALPELVSAQRICGAHALFELIRIRNDHMLDERYNEFALRQRTMLKEPVFLATVLQVKKQLAEIEILVGRSVQ